MKDSLEDGQGRWDRRDVFILLILFLGVSLFHIRGLWPGQTFLPVDLAGFTLSRPQVSPRGVALGTSFLAGTVGLALCLDWGQAQAHREALPTLGIGFGLSLAGLLGSAALLLGEAWARFRRRRPV